VVVYERCAQLLLKNWDVEKFPELKERKEPRDIKDKLGPDQKMWILEQVVSLHAAGANRSRPTLHVDEEDSQELWLQNPVTGAEEFLRFSGFVTYCSRSVDRAVA
jgi:hypothetical protein